MKAKVIKSVLRKKIDSWIASIEDAELRNAARRDVIVTGGCIASMLLKEPVNDFDVYFKTRDTTKAVAAYYLKRFKPKNAAGIACEMYVDESKPDRIRLVIKSAGIASEDGAETPYEYFEGAPDEAAGGYVAEVLGSPGDIEDAYQEAEGGALAVEDTDYRAVFMSTNAITLSGRLQIVLRFYGEPDELHENYDFVHCTNYWTSQDNQLVLRQAALESLLARELRYVGSKYPVCSVIRLRKFIKRNWTINAGQILKMMMQITDLDLHNPEVLEDQLTGVDSAYFIELMTKVKEKDPDKVNTAYLVEIIDRMF